MPHFIAVAAGLDHVEVGQGVAVGRDDHARAAALPAGHERRPARSPWPCPSRRSAGPRPPRPRRPARRGRKRRRQVTRSPQRRSRATAWNKQCLVQARFPAPLVPSSGHSGGQCRLANRSHLTILALHNKRRSPAVRLPAKSTRTVKRRTPATSTSTVWGAWSPAISPSHSGLSSPRMTSRTLPPGRAASSMPAVAVKRRKPAGSR